MKPIVQFRVILFTSLVESFAQETEKFPHVILTQVIIILPLLFLSNTIVKIPTQKDWNFVAQFA